MPVNSHETLSNSIDIQYERTSGSCKLRGIDEICGDAIEDAVQREKCAAQASSAKVQVVCEGKILGMCGAQINGELMDADNTVLCQISTTAAELRTQQAANEQESSEIRNIRALVEDVFTSEPHDRL